MKDSSRTQGRLICIGAAVLGLWFLIGILQKSYWAVAIPVAIAVFFALGLSFWVGWTIATIEVEPFEDREPPRPEPAAPTAPDRPA